MPLARAMAFLAVALVAKFILHLTITPVFGGSVPGLLGILDLVAAAVAAPWLTLGTANGRGPRPRWRTVVAPPVVLLGLAATDLAIALPTIVERSRDGGAIMLGAAAIVIGEQLAIAFSVLGLLAWAASGGVMLAIVRWRWSGR